jgi:hypothetical protein
MRNRCRGITFTELLSRNGLQTPFIKIPLPHQRASFRDRNPVAGLHTTILNIVVDIEINLGMTANLELIL